MQIPQITLVSPGCCLLLGPALLASDKAAAAPSSRSRQWAALSRLTVGSSPPPSQLGSPIGPLAPRLPSILFPGRPAGCRVHTPHRALASSLLSSPLLRPPPLFFIIPLSLLAPAAAAFSRFSNRVFFPPPVIFRSMFSLSLFSLSLSLSACQFFSPSALFLACTLLLAHTHALIPSLWSFFLSSSLSPSLSPSLHLSRAVAF